MKRQINPFIIGHSVPHADFIGRTSVIENCYNWLAGRVPTCIAISGEHGIGKTSLLYYLGHVAREEEWGQPATRLFVLLDCQGIRPFTPPYFWRRVLESLRQAEDRSGLHRQIDPLLEQSEFDHTHVQQQVLGWLNQRRSSLVLLLDSCAWIVDAYRDEPDMVSHFLSGLRSLTNHPDSGLTLVTATREPLNILCAEIVKKHPGSAFYNNFVFQPLEPFAEDEIAALLQKAQDETGFEFDDEQRGFLSRLGGAHPALFQMAGYYLFETMRDGSFSVEARRKIIKEFEQAAARVYFSAFWDESSTMERTLFVLLILAQLLDRTSAKLDVTRPEIDGLLNKYERDLIGLAERGLVRKIDDTYQIASVVFARWILRNVAAESEALYANHGEIANDELLYRVWQSVTTLAPQLTLDPLIPMLVQRSTQAPGAPPSIPSRYKLQGEVGRGASSIVYKAYDTSLDRTVAVKSLHGPLATDPGTGHRLLKEAQAASKLHHPCIVVNYDILDVDNHIWLVMEYVDGRSLADILHDEGRLPLERVIAFLEQAADALDYAHGQGVIHRDIKPANLLITATGALKLADFGIAKVMGAPHTTQDGEFKGTVIYMSPEQVGGEKTLDGRSDLFSLASVAFEMLTGASPWPGASVLGIMNSIEEAKARRLTEFDLPGAAMLEPVFRKALAKNPADRYATCKEFVQALKKVPTYTGVHGTGKRWAVLVGVNTYEDETHYARLRLCVKDVNAICEQLVASGFDASRVHLLADETAEAPTRDNILATLKATADATEPDDLLLFYYSGHGDVDGGESFLVARNGRRVVLSDTAVRLSRVKEILERAPARAKVIVLDACRCGANIEGGRGDTPMSPEFFQYVFEQAEGLAIMASCTQGQLSYEWDDFKGGVFTHFLLEALAGKADRDGKGFVTVQDANRHVVSGVKEWASRRKFSQTPTLHYTVAGDIILAFY